MILKIVILTILFEAVTVLFRFGFNITIKKDFRWLGKLSFGYRLHHGYWGLALVMVSYLAFTGTAQEHGLILGWALFLSDIIHHFVVLQLFTGNHEFELRFPNAR